MLERLYGDPDFRMLNKKNVERIILLTGTNYVDSIAANALDIKVAFGGIELLANRLWSTFANAQLYVTNILPRADVIKNNVVTDLNKSILKMCRTHGLFYIDTEVENRLFTDTENNRKEKFFSKGYDNVHLNRIGVTRLGKHLKFIAHRCSIQSN
jgi:hypothetical protein